MKQKLLNKLWLRVGMIVAIMTTALSGTVWAEEVLYYTLDGTQTGGTNGYATESEITQNDITWMVTGNTTLNPWRIGGKNLSGENRPVYSTSTMSPNITKVVVTNGTATATVNSMTLVVSSNSDFSNPTSTVTGTWAASSTTTFERPSGADWSNKYFKLIYNVTAGGSNQYAQLVKAEFYYDNSGSSVKPIPTITVSSPVDALGDAMSTLYVNENFYVTVTTTSDAPITYTSDANELYVHTWNTETGKMCLIPHVAGQVSITYSVAETDNYAAAEKTETFTIVKTSTTCEIVVPEGFNNNIANGTTAGKLKGQIQEITSYNSQSDNSEIASFFTWTSSNTDVATIAADGTVTLVSAGATTITCNFAGDATYAASSTTYSLSVINGEYVQPTTIEANLNNSLFGTNYNGSVNGLTDANALSGTIDNVTVTYGGGGNHYVNNTQIRFYPNNKLTFAAPAGYEITKIEFTSAGTWAATINAGKGTYNSDSKTWTGSETSVTFTGSGSSRCDMSKATITIGLPSTEPVINADDEINVDYNVTEGSFDYTINNPVQDGSVSIDYDSDGDWLLSATENNGTVSFTCTANNTNAEREALVEITYTYNTNETVTKDVLITQAAAPVTPPTPVSGKYVKVTSTDDLTDGQYLIVYEEGSVAFNGGLETLDAVGNTIAVTLSNNEIAATSTTTAAEFTIDVTKGTVTKGTIKSASGKYIGQTSDANGLTSNAETLYENNISIDEGNEGNADIVSGGAYLRYNSASNQTRFRYYKSSSYTGQQAIQLYKKVESVTVTNAGYATYCSENALDFTDTDIKAYVGTKNGDKLTFTPITQVPANTGMLLVYAGGKTENVPVIASATAVEGNCLVGVNVETNISSNDYILNKVNDGVGFYRAGSYTELGAHKAYIPAAVGDNVKGFTIDFEDDATGIEETLSNSPLKGENIYNLAGQMVNGKSVNGKLPKGIYIVNGKKIMVK